MAEEFQNAKALTGMDQLIYIRQNYQEIFKYILENKHEIRSSPENSQATLEIMSQLFDGKNFASNFQAISELLLVCISKTTYTTTLPLAKKFLKKMFSVFCTSNLYKEGLQFFRALNEAVDTPMFASFKAYLIYFSYHTKDYSPIAQMLSIIISYADLNETIENVDHSMYYYYKGLIHLRMAEYEKAYISFCVCIQSYVLQKGLLVTQLQLEAIKHIIIMTFIPSLEKYKSLNQFLFAKMKKLGNLKELEAFSELFLVKNVHFGVWIDKNKLILKQAKLLGLTKIAYKENEKSKLMSVLKKYKRIHVKTLIQILDISEESLLFYLKTLIQRNEVNIQYDEVENIIEVLPVDYCNEDMFDKLKSNYECLTNENNDIANAIKLIKEVHLKKQKIQMPHSQLPMNMNMNSDPRDPRDPHDPHDHRMQREFGMYFP